MTKAYREAAVRGTVTGRVGQGTFVTRRASAQKPSQADGFVHLDVNLSPDVGQREILQAHHQAFHNARRVGAAAAGNRQNKWGCKHL